MRVNYIHLIAASALVGGATPRQQSTVDAVIDKAVATYNKTKTSRGTFEQAITNPLTGSTVKIDSSTPKENGAGCRAVTWPAVSSL